MLICSAPCIVWDRKIFWSRSLKVQQRLMADVGVKLLFHFRSLCVFIPEPGHLIEFWVHRGCGFTELILVDKVLTKTKEVIVMNIIWHFWVTPKERGADLGSVVFGDSIFLELPSVFVHMPFF